MGQQQSNIAASLGSVLSDVPNYVTSFRNYKMIKRLKEKPVKISDDSSSYRSMMSRFNYGNTPLLNTPPTMTDPEYSSAIGINPYSYSLNQIPFSEMDVPQEAYEFFPERRRFARMSPAFR